MIQLDYEYIIPFATIKEGKRAAADSLPTAILYRNGAASGLTITVSTTATTGRYHVTFTTAAGWAKTDRLYLDVQATIDAEVFDEIIWDSYSEPDAVMRGTDGGPTVAAFEARSLPSADYFDPATDTVANVTLVATTTTNTDMRGTDSALLAASYTAPANADITAIKTKTDQFVFTIANQVDSNALTGGGGGGLDAAGVRSAIGLATANLDTQLADVPTVAEFNARSLPSADYFDPATDTVANVTLVATTTTNTDMRGTDGANTEASKAFTFGSGPTIQIADTAKRQITWPTASETITGTIQWDGQVSKAITGAITFRETISGNHFYDWAYNAADRPPVPGYAVIQFTDGVFTDDPLVVGFVSAPTVAAFEARTLPSADYFVVGDYTAPANADITSIKTKTDQFVFTVANQVDSNALSGGGGGGLDAAGVRSAIGLATANLDTQLADVPTVAEFNARSLPSADYFDPATDTVANVTLVATTTTNTDMRGTDNALLAASYTAPANADIAAILVDTDATIPGLIDSISGLVLAPAPTVERVLGDEDAIRFSWPTDGATITGEVSKAGGAYAAVTGAISQRANDNGFWYQLAYNAADRQLGSVRYKFTDGTSTRYVNLLVNPASAEVDESAIAGAVWVNVTRGLTEEVTTNSASREASKADVSALALQTTLNDVLTDTGTTLPAVINAIDGGLDAAGVRAAVGLASANLDTQLSTIDTVVDTVLADTNELQLNQNNWVTATGFSTLTTSDIRTAVGLGSANLDTQLANIPTVAEFEARTLPSGSYFDPAVDTVARVTLVDTVTINTDMVSVTGITTELAKVPKVGQTHRYSQTAVDADNRTADVAISTIP